MELTVLDWNVGHVRPQFRRPGTVDRQLQYIRNCEPQPLFLLLQELGRPEYESYKSALGDRYWATHSLPYGGNDPPKKETR
jgi:hypothetical protein